MRNTEGACFENILQLAWSLLVWKAIIKASRCTIQLEIFVLILFLRASKAPAGARWCDCSFFNELDVSLRRPASRLIGFCKFPPNTQGSSCLQQELNTGIIDHWGSRMGDVKKHIWHGDHEAFWSLFCLFSGIKIQLTCCSCLQLRQCC